MIEFLLLAMLAAQVVPLVNPPAYTGTFQTVAQADGSLVRMDTRTGEAQKCVVQQNALVCKKLELKND